MIERVGAPIPPTKRIIEGLRKDHHEANCRLPGGVTARWIAQMKPHNSRATAVTTIVGRLPLLMSAR
jgi:hypothetical protein